MALTEPKGTLEEQMRTREFAARLHAEKQRIAEEEAAVTSEPRQLDDGAGTVWTYVIIAGKKARVEKCETTASALVVPEKFEGVPTLAIAPQAIAGNPSIEEVHIPSCAKEIGAYVFRSCPNIRIADMGCEADAYDPNWLKGCTKVEELVLPNAAANLKPNIFDLPNLKKLTIGRSYDSIEPGCFAKSKLEEVTLHPDNSAFTCDGTGIYTTDGETFVCLVKPCESYEIADGVTVVAKKATNNFAALCTVKIPDTLQMLDEFAFSRTGITEFVAPAGLHTIAKQAFFNCRSMTKLVLNEGLTVVGDEAFGGTSIQSLHLPKTVRRLGKKVVDRTPLTYSGEDATFTIDSQSDALYMDVYGCLYAKEPEGLRLIRAMDPAIDEAHIAEGTYLIGEGAFLKHPNLGSVTLPEGLKEIGANAFRDCYKLRDVEWCETLERIGDNAFTDTEIGYFYVPASLESLGYMAIITRGAHHEEYLPSLEEVEVNPGNEKFYMVDGMLIEHTGEGRAQVVVYDGSCEEVHFPDEVDTVCAYAFKGSEGVKKLWVSDRIKQIDMRGLAIEEVLDDIYIEYTKPIQSHDHFHFSFPKTKRGKHQQNNALGLLKQMDVEVIYRAYDLTITNSARFDKGNDDEDDMDIYEQAKHLLARLKDPIFLSPVHADIIKKMFEFHAGDLGLALARNDDRKAIDDLVELGYIHKDNIMDIVDRVAVLKDAATTGHMLELVRMLGRDENRYEL